jgi:hypothetical protein
MVRQLTFNNNLAVKQTKEESAKSKAERLYDEEVTQRQWDVVLH